MTPFVTPLLLAFLLVACGGGGGMEPKNQPGGNEPGPVEPTGSAPVLERLYIRDYAVPVVVDEIPTCGRAWYAARFQDDDLDALVIYITVFRWDGAQWAGFKFITWVLTPQVATTEEQCSEVVLSDMPAGDYRAEAWILDAEDNASNTLATEFCIIEPEEKVDAK